MHWGTVIVAGFITSLLVGGFSIGFISFFDNAPWAVATSSFLSGAFGAKLFSEIERKDFSN